MKLAVVTVILFAAPLAAAAPARSPDVPRLRHETIGIRPSSTAGGVAGSPLGRKEDDTAIGRSLTAASSASSAPVKSPFQAVEATVMRKRPKATGRIRVSFDVDRRGRVVRPMVFGFDAGLDRAIEAQLKASQLPIEYRGQHIETVLAFQRGKLLRR